MTTRANKISSHEFQRSIGRAKRAANRGPVVIIDRGRPAYVLLRHDAYLRLLDKAPTIRDVLGQPGAEDMEFDPPHFGAGLFRPPSLS
jgi:PHD/YefM family antitoxin component YafN of YafNO toxin-antitoxin module